MFGAKSERRPNFAAAAVGKSLHLGPETRRRGPEIDDRRRPENKIGQTKNIPLKLTNAAAPLPEPTFVFFEWSRAETVVLDSLMAHLNSIEFVNSFSNLAPFLPVQSDDVWLCC